MSGAEVVLGVVAGGAGLMSLSIQLAESAVKLKRFYHSMRNAPEALNSTADEIQVMSLSLRLIIRHWQTEIQPADILDRCIENCRRHVTSIEELVGKLSQKLDKGSLSGKLYAAIREHDLDKLLNDLDRSRAALHLAVQLYHQEEQAHRWLIQQNNATTWNEQLATMQKTLQTHEENLKCQLSQILQHTRSHHIQEPEEISPRLICSRRLKRANGLVTGQASTRRGGKQNSETTSLRINLRLPSWLSCRVWEITRVDAQAGWDLRFRTYNRRPCDSELFLCCTSGDLEGLKRLIQNGEASLFDVDEEGRNLISVSANWRFGSSLHLSLIRWLVEQNVTLHGKELFDFLFTGLHMCRAEPQDGEELLQLFIDDSDEFAQDMSLRRFAKLWQACGSVTIINLLSQKFARYLQSLTAKQRVRFIRATLDLADSATLYKAKINQSHVKPYLNRYFRANATTVLFDVTQAFARTRNWLGVEEYDFSMWTRIGIAAIKNGADIFATRKFKFRNNRSCTPLLSLFPALQRREFTFEVISLALKFWIRMLREANVDLPTYCSEESKVWRSIGAHYILRSPLGLPGRTVHLMAVDFDPDTQRCNVRVCEEFSLPIMRLHYLPGSFTCRTEVPDEICWFPNSAELEEGHWISSGPDIPLRGKVMDLKELSQQYAETYAELVDSTQDDNGFLMRVIDESQHNSRPRKRSSSQPAPLYRRRHHYTTIHSSRVHQWLPRMHFCIDRSAWVTSKHEGSDSRNHLAHYIAGTFVDTRRCVNGDDVLDSSIPWFRFAFVRLSQLCQTGDEYFVNSPGTVHDGTRNCPQGCGNINFSTIQNPHSLPVWHPGSYDSEP